MAMLEVDGSRERVFYVSDMRGIHPFMIRLTLLQRDDCHLCDAALEILASAHAPDFRSRWVDDEPELQARYGLRVPVLRDEDSGRELDWPFDVAAVVAFVAAHRVT